VPQPPQEAILPTGSVLQHVSREVYRDDALYFGRAVQHRYDDPAGGYGVLYATFNLATALMESVFHKHRWWRIGAQRTITLSEVQSRMVRIVELRADLVLCDLASEGAAARVFGLDATRLATRRYASTRALSATIDASTTRIGAAFDGIVYPSHNNPGARCVALLDRAQAHVVVTDDIRLDDHRDWPAFVADYDVRVLPR
jgi:hypothetical protein